MTCSMPPRRPHQRPVRSHTPLVDRVYKRIIQLSFHPLPRLSFPSRSPTTDPPHPPDLIPAGLSLSLRMRVPEIAMQPSEDCPNAHNNLVANFVPPRTNFRVKHPPVCHVLFVPYIPVTLILLSAPQKSMFRPPKLAPSAWQLYFTDWIQRFHARSTKKLNVAQAAKEAGQDYANLSADEKEVRFFFYLICISPIFDRGSHCSAIQAPGSGCQRCQGEGAKRIQEN